MYGEAVWGNSCFPQYAHIVSGTGTLVCLESENTKVQPLQIQEGCMLTRQIFLSLRGE